MPVQSKIVSPTSVSPGSEEAHYHARSRYIGSLSPQWHGQNDPHTFIKHESGLSSGSRSTHGSSSRLTSNTGSAHRSYQRASGLASTSGFTSTSGFAFAPDLAFAPGPASFSPSMYQSHQTPAPMSRHNHSPQSHAAASPEHDHISSELQTLRAENKSLKRELQNLHGRFDIISYVLVVSRLHQNHSYCQKRKARHSHRKSG